MEETQNIYHVFFLTYSRKSDYYATTIARDVSHLNEKIERYLYQKKADFDTVVVYTEAEFSKKFSQPPQAFYALYQNGTGQKLCRIHADNSESAGEIFKKRFPEKEPTTILDERQFSQIKVIREDKISRKMAVNE